MKNIAAFILLLPLLTQVSSRYLVMLDFELNKNHIAKTLCVNRNKPMSGCNGKCYLKKQLAKASKQEHAPNSNIRDHSNEVLFLTAAKKITIYFYIEEGSWQYLSGRKPFIPHNLHCTIFHPPPEA